MTDLQHEIGQALKLVSSILVSGDAVDIMALAKEHLRRAYQMAGAEKGGTADG